MISEINELALGIDLGPVNSTPFITGRTPVLGP